jgi:hypothetical protein
MEVNVVPFPVSVCLIIIHGSRAIGEPGLMRTYDLEMPVKLQRRCPASYTGKVKVIVTRGRDSFEH